MKNMFATLAYVAFVGIAMVGGYSLRCDNLVLEARLDHEQWFLDNAKIVMRTDEGDGREIILWGVNTRIDPVLGLELTPSSELRIEERRTGPNGESLIGWQ